MANGAVRLSIGLRLVGFIHVFQKGDANGHHKVESVAKIIIFENKSKTAAVAKLFIQSASNLVCPSLGDVEKL